MEPSSPTAEYFEARRRYLEVQAVDDLLLRAQQMQELNREWENCFRLLMEAAEINDPEVWYALGDACQNARGTRQDRSAALHWFQLAAEAGHAKAMVSLGHCFQRSERKEDKMRAVEWFRKSADAGEPSGMIWLGFAHRDGTGVAADHQKAVEWFIKAVEAGDGHSMIYVGRLYARQLQSPSHAIWWFLRAAGAGYTESHVELSMLYDDRALDTYDAVEAVKWWRVVAKGGSSSVGRAALALARHCRDGVGTSRDVEAAREWLQLALKSCHQKSSLYREATKLMREMDASLL